MEEHVGRRQREADGRALPAQANTRTLIRSPSLAGSRLGSGPLKHAVAIVVIACLGLLASGPSALATCPPVEPVQKEGLFHVPDGDATVALTLRLPDDATDAERLSLVGAKLVLAGRSNLAHGPDGELLNVTVDAALQVHGTELHQWIYELRATEFLFQFKPDAAVGPFRIKRDQHFYPRWGEHFEAVIELERHQDISGVVVNSSGEPVEGAQVVVAWRRRSFHGIGVRETRTTDADGRFVFEEMPQGPSSVSAETDPWELCRLYGEEIREAQQAPGGLRLVLKVDDAARQKAQKKEAQPKTRHSLKGTVSGLSKAELEECVVCFAPTARLRQQPQLASTVRRPRHSVSPDPETGAFELTRVPWGPTTVWADIKRGSIVRRSERVSVDSDDETPAVPLAIAAPGRLQGRLLDTEGRAVADAALTLQQTTGSSALSTVRITTNTEGEFAHNELPPGTYRATLKHERYVLANDGSLGDLTITAGEPRNDVKLTAVLGGWIALEMIHWTGQPLAPGADFSVLCHDKKPLHASTRWPLAVIDGSIRLGPYRPGTYRVQRQLSSVNRHAGIQAFQDVTVVGGEVAAVTLDERTQGFDQVKTRCKGRVLINGKPALAASVSIRDEIWHLASCFTNVDGEFELAVPKAGPLTLTANAYVEKLRSETTIVLTTNEVTTIELTLTPN